MIFYITPDVVGVETGGGVVTMNEIRALETLGQSVHVFARNGQTDFPSDPFEQDEFFLQLVREFVSHNPGPISLVHCYAGCLGKTLTFLKSLGAKITYTIAAHDRFVSRKAHEEIGIPFDYKHLTEEESWKKYSLGMMIADVVIVPSSHSHAIVKREGYSGRMRCIPHGADLPGEIAKSPERFTVGYLGVIGADKGLTTLLRAWKKLAYKDATLIFAGKNTCHPQFLDIVSKFGGGNIHCVGWTNNKTRFFDSISVYCQPSVTEGFGITALEAMGHGKTVICSTGAGVCDLIGGHWRFPAGDVNYLCNLIEKAKADERKGMSEMNFQLKEAAKYTWDKIRQQYVDLWRSML